MEIFSKQRWAIPTPESECIILGLSKGCTKCQGSKVYLVVSSKFYESVIDRREIERSLKISNTIYP